LKKAMGDPQQPKATQVPVPVRARVPVMGQPPRPDEMPRPLMMVDPPARDHRPLMRAAPGAFHGDFHAELARLLWCAAFVLGVVVVLARLATG
jgi:hypothetical protein